MKFNVEVRNVRSVFSYITARLEAKYSFFRSRCERPFNNMKFRDILCCYCTDTHTLESFTNKKSFTNENLLLTKKKVCIVFSTEKKNVSYSHTLSIKLSRALYLHAVSSTPLLRQSTMYYKKEVNKPVTYSSLRFYAEEDEMAHGINIQYIARFRIFRLCSVAILRAKLNTLYYIFVPWLYTVIVRVSRTATYYNIMTTLT